MDVRYVCVLLWAAACYACDSGDPSGHAEDTAGGGQDAATGDGDDVGVDASAAVSCGEPQGCTAVICPGEGAATELQTALIEAASGDVVCLGAGTYEIAVELSLSIAGVTVKGAGMEKTILDLSGQIVGANGMLVSGDGVTLEDFAIVDPAGDGVRADLVSGLTFRRVRVEWSSENDSGNGGYGLYPVQCHDVLVDGCVVAGASDAGIYVGQSTQALVIGSTAHRNVVGIEIENTTDAEVTACEVFDNAGGIFVFNLPEPPVKDGKRAKVHNNLVENNNRKNFALEGAIVAKVPSGSGMVILASDQNELHDNVIRGNRTFGVSILSYSELAFGSFEAEDFDPYPERNWVHDNTLTGNGLDPEGIAKLISGGKSLAQLTWDGCINAAKGPGDDLTNCFSDNAGADFLDFDLCGGLANPSTDLTALTCKREPLDPLAFEAEGR